MSNDEQPLSAAQMQAVEAARYTTTARTHQEANIGAMYQQKAEIINKAVGLIQDDTLGINHTLLRTWLARHESTDADLMVGDSYLAEGNIAAWQQYVAGYNTANLATIEQTDFNNYVLYRQILLNAQADSRGQDQLNQSEVAQVENIALANDGMLSRTAKNLLEWFYGYSFGTGLLIGGNEDRNAEKENKQGETTEAPIWVKCYPNPARHEIIFERPILAVGAEMPLLTVMNSLGQRQTLRYLANSHTHLNLEAEGLRGGLYYYTLTQGNKIVQSGKFIVR